MVVTIFKNIKATSAGYHREVDYILERIKNGKSKNLVEAIRKTPIENDEQIAEFKRQLPSVCFSGTFKQRNDESIIKHSGLICLDFDKFPDIDSLHAYREDLSNNEYIFAVWISPSGRGLKTLVKIPSEVENHKAYFNALKDYFNSQYFDISCSNVSRVCYESYDPEIFVNHDSLLWIEKEEHEVYSIGSDSPSLILKSENRIIQNLIKWWEGKHGNTKGSRNNNLFKLAMAFNDFGVSKHEAESTLKQYSDVDFTEKEIDNIIKSAYKNTANHGTKFFEDKFLKQKIEKQVRSGSSLKKIQEAFISHTEIEIENAVSAIKENLSVTEFWEYDDKGKLRLKPHKFKEYLEQQGFYKLYPAGADNFIFIKVDENMVDNTTPVNIKDHVLDYLYNSSEFGINPYDFMASTPKHFKEDYLNLLNTSKIEFKEDTQDRCYLYFKNCAVEITKDSINKIDYVDLQGFIWRKHIINRDFEELEANNSVFKRFFELIAGGEQDRFISLCTVMGYLLHSFKTSKDNKAIIFNDEVISENPNGGSGKGLFCSAIGHMKRVSTLDGKQFDFNKSFPYQTVGADTQVLIFDDVKKNFAFENLFSLVTEGITLEKKNKDAIKLPIQKSPKIVITTNYTIGGIGGSFERRKFEVELSSYFGSHYTPFDEFGHQLFDDWDKKEWQLFDNFMIFCVQIYLESGLQKHEFKNLEVRKFIKETSFEFNEWVDEHGLSTGELLFKSDLYFEFTEEYPDTKKYLSQKKFSQWLEVYGKFKGYEVSHGKTGKRWIKFN